MELREYQEDFVNNCIRALQKHGNTLGVAPTGSGKTIILAHVIKMLQEQNIFFKVCVLAHRKELTEQNSEKFLRVNPETDISFVTAETKNWSGQVVFAMVQTLANKRTLHSMPFLDLLVVDETHHITAKSYLKIIKQAKEDNPNVMIFGVTATPNRGDKCNLGKIFSNCADQISIAKLIDTCHLVPPKTFIVDVAKGKLEALKVSKNTGDYSEEEVANILNTRPINEDVIKHWKIKAGDRKTVIFCSTIEHAKDVSDAFKSHGINAVLVTSEMSKEKRENALSDIVSGEAQVLVNVAILTEGWDFPPISCVVLLRQSSYKSTMVQMIGRGLRAVDESLYPGIIKHDCIVLDFGISTALHKKLEEDVDLDWVNAKERKKTKGHDQECPKCKKIIPLRVAKCTFCGYVFEPEIKSQPPEKYKFSAMDELNLLQDERFNLHWLPLKTKVKTYFTSGFKIWSCILRKCGKWLVVVGDNQKEKEMDTEILGEYKGYLAAFNKAERFFKKFEKYCTKNEEWRNFTATEKQRQLLPEEYQDVHLSKGEASILLAFKFKAQRELHALGLLN